MQQPITRPLCSPTVSCIRFFTMRTKIFLNDTTLSSRPKLQLTTVGHPFFVNVNLYQERYFHLYHCLEQSLYFLFIIHLQFSLYFYTYNLLYQSLITSHSISIKSSPKNILSFSKFQETSLARKGVAPPLV